MGEFKPHELVLFNKNACDMHSFRVAILLSVCVVVSLGRWLVSWSIIEATQVDLTFQMLFEEIKSGKLDCIPQSQELRN